MSKLTPLFFFFVLITLSSCKEKTLFTSLPASETGITFANRITENDTMNILSFEYIYNGGGVGLGDFNNDSLTDIYFTGNTTTNQLYLNKGDFKFENVTQKAGVEGLGRWSSGVAVVDINNDGKLDLYVCTTAKKSANQRANLLYVNQGNDKNKVPIFKEMAQEYGIADTTHTTNAAFFDYDNDGDLDLYLVTNEMDATGSPNKYHEKLVDGSSPRTDRLYENQGSPLASKVGVARKISPSEASTHFVDVSKKAGILIEGYGLGVNICDINQDGWKDIYVTNDYLTNDLLYINNKNGTFTNQADAYFKHTSHSAMGNDINDINNDGLPDVIAVDMMPEDNYRKKMMTLPNSYLSYQNNNEFGYQYQYARNTLQLNQGKNAAGQPVFSEIGMMANINQTDWSWTPMVTDFDNDGFRDIIITNGFPKDITDQDFIVYRAEVGNLLSKIDMVDYIPKVKIKNYAFKNKGDLTFENTSEAWGITQPSFSNGAAYADLDNDGDLDYVVNNINDSASVYRNNLRELLPQKSNYLRVKFKGSPQNPMGQGTLIKLLYADGRQQVYENTIYRGYLSSIENVAHFGLGSDSQIAEVRILWANGKQQILKNVKANQVILADINKADIYFSFDEKITQTTNFQDITQSLGIQFKHEEDDFIDFNGQKLLPHKFSEYGPYITKGDINQDGLEDMFVGGSTQHKGQFFIQQTDGTFLQKDLLPEISTQKMQEDRGCLLFDADGDGDADLYVVSGGSENPKDSENYQDRLYLNDGKGNFKIDLNALPKFLKSGSCVKAFDFDKDGDLDLFIGGRVEPNGYPKPVSSYLLRNDSQTKGVAKFTDVTAQLAPELQNIGLICDATWADIDNDSWADLVLAGEWMPITILKNTKGKKLNNRIVEPSTTQQLKTQVGWWNCLASGDFDKDGDIDFIAGNFGTNTLWKASDSEPVSVYGKDFNGDGNYDAIPTVYFKDEKGRRKEFPYNVRDDMVKQIIQTRMKYPTFAKYANTTLDEMWKPEELKDALLLRANQLQSSYFENIGNGQFTLHTLPIEAQFAPLSALSVADYDHDGLLDCLAIGNDFSVEVQQGRADAFNGLFLKGNGKGGFKPIRLDKSGFYVEGNAKSICSLKGKNKTLIAVTQNKGKMKVFEVR